MLSSILWKDVEKNNTGCVQGGKKAAKGKHGSSVTFYFIRTKHAHARKDGSQVNYLKTLEKEQQIKPKTSKRKKVKCLRAEISELKNRKTTEKN